MPDALWALLGVLTGALIAWGAAGDRTCNCPPQPLPRYPYSPVSVDGKVDPRHQDPTI